MSLDLRTQRLIKFHSYSISFLLFFFFFMCKFFKFYIPYITYPRIKANSVVCRPSGNQKNKIPFTSIYENHNGRDRLIN